MTKHWPPPPKKKKNLYQLFIPPNLFEVSFDILLTHLFLMHPFSTQKGALGTNGLMKLYTENRLISKNKQLMYIVYHLWITWTNLLFKSHVWFPTASENCLAIVWYFEHFWAMIYSYDCVQKSLWFQFLRCIFFWMTIFKVQQDSLERPHACWG